MTRIQQRRLSRRGFTLIEVLIVVVILGILAATVLPQFTRASEDARESAVVSDLQTFRNQLEVYKYQHRDKYPADGTTDATLFTDQLLKSTDADGTVGPAGTKPFGPYLIGKLPPNPYNDKSDVLVVNNATLPPADDSTGWTYSSLTGVIKANTVATTKDGTPVQDL